MRKREFERVMALLAKATPAQLRAAESRLTQLNNAAAVLVMAETRITRKKACPYCSSQAFHLWGRTPSGVQRYRCSHCRRSFGALTGTAFSRIHNKVKLLENAIEMRDFWSVRETAERLGVHRNTAFRYRHLMLPSLSKQQPTSLGGVAEADEMFFRRSYKGQKTGMPRPPHKRGMPAKKRGLSGEQVPVLTAISRGTRRALMTVLPEPVNAAAIETVLRPVLGVDAVLCSDSASAYKAAAKAMGIHLRQIPSGSHKLGPYHIQNANGLHSRVRGRMRVFKGVATKYLDGYLAWIRFFDCAPERDAAKAFLLDAFDLAPPGTT